MNTLPFEILEQIIAYLPTEDLFSLCHTDRTLFKLVRHEAYKRWKQCTIKYGELFWRDQDLYKIWDELESNDESDEDTARLILIDKMKDNWVNQMAIAEQQLIIMRKMKNHSMIVDEQEKEIIDYCTNMRVYSISPWGLNWSWDYEEWSEYDTSENSASEESEYDTSEDSASEDSTSKDEW